MLGLREFTLLIGHRLGSSCAQAPVSKDAVRTDAFSAKVVFLRKLESSLLGGGMSSACAKRDADTVDTVNWFSRR